MEGVAIRALGRLEVSRRGRSIPLRRATERNVIAALVAAGREGLSVEELRADLEEAKPPAPSESAVRQALYRLTKKLPELINEAGAYRLDVPAEAVDTWYFDQSMNDHDLAAVARILGEWQGEPFADLESTLRVHSERERLRERRVSSLRRVARATDRFSAERVELLLAGIRAEPFQEDLVAETALALYRCGRQTRALDLIRDCRRRFLEQLGLDTSPILDDAELAVLRQQPVEAAPLAWPMPIAGGPTTSPPPNQRFVGRKDMLRSLAELFASAKVGPGRLVMVSAAGGLGKTSLMNEFASRLQTTGLTVRRGTGSVGPAIAYGPLLEALPELREQTHLLETEDPSVGRLIFAQRFERLLHRIGRNGAAVVLLDDLHYCDAASASLLRSLGSMAVPRNVLMVLAARPEVIDQAWVAARTAIEASQLCETIALPPLTRDELVELVQIDHPALDGMLQIRLADQLLDASGGNPFVAATLSTSVINGEAASFPMIERSDDPTADRLATHLPGRVPEQTAELLSVAALIGLDFGLSTLATLSGVPELETLAHLDRALASGLVVEAAVDRFRFDHELTRQVFASRTSDSRRRRLYADLARSPRVRGRAVARYVRESEGFLEPSDAIQLLIRSGNELEQEQAFVDAATAFELATSLMEAHGEQYFELAVRLAACWTRAGAIEAGRDWRAKAAAAVTDNDSDRLCRVAMAGLPAGVSTGGDADRLALLERIDLAAITSYPLRIVRQNMLNQARMLNDRAAFERLVTQTPPDCNADPALHTHELVNGAIGTEAKRIARDLRALITSTPEGPDRTAMRVHELWSALIEQEPGAGTNLFEEVAAEVRRHPTPRQTWSIQAIDAALNQAGLRSSGATPARALETGLRLGVPDAFDGWAAQQFVDLWLSGRLAEALHLIDAAGHSMRKNVAWEGVVGLSAAAAGDLSRARAQASSVQSAIRSGPSVIWTQIAAAALIESTVFTRDAGPAAFGASILMSRSGQALLVGLGVGHLGPADRYLGLAACLGGEADPAELFASAIRQANRSGASVWATRAEIDLKRWEQEA